MSGGSIPVDGGQLFGLLLTKQGEKAMLDLVNRMGCPTFIESHDSNRVSASPACRATGLEFVSREHHSKAQVCLEIFEAVVSSTKVASQGEG